jgi:hypothetical protein
MIRIGKSLVVALFVACDDFVRDEFQPQSRARQVLRRPDARRAGYRKALPRLP